MTKLKKLILQFTVIAMISTSVLIAAPRPAEATFMDIPTVDEGEVDRLEGLADGGIDSDGCSDLKSEIGAARTAMQRYRSEHEAASTIQEAQKWSAMLRNGKKWLRSATTLYETNCLYVGFGGGPGDGGGPAS